MSYYIAWIVVIAVAAALSVLVYVPLRKRKLLALLFIALGCFWAVWPIRFGEGHFAPLFVVVVFRTFFEPDANPSSVLATGLLGSLAIVIAYFAIVIIRRAIELPGRPSQQSNGASEGTGE